MVTVLPESLAGPETSAKETGRLELAEAFTVNGAELVVWLGIAANEIVCASLPEVETVTSWVAAV
jgi:hypothetical protein